VVSVDPLVAFRLDGRVAVVTGASSGLGARFARVLDALGATVVVAARRAERLEALASTLRDGHAVACDVSVRGASAGLVDGVVERYGRVDVVVANAGISSVQPALRESTDVFAEVVEVDLVAPFELARAAAGHMRAAGEGGSVVNVASSVGLRTLHGFPQAGYNASKAGLIGLTRELAVQWARYGVRVNALCPGMFPSEMTAGLRDSAENLAAFEATLPTRRLGREDELDAALAFMASPASSYMTGQTVVVDGGMSL
jgi:NAD(P)-dependent dehydrogenase (short-subunit alcohol dehydrogenase family)